MNRDKKSFVRFLRLYKISALIALAGLKRISKQMESHLESALSEEAESIIINSDSTIRKIFDQLSKVGISRKLSALFVKLANAQNAEFFPNEIVDQELPQYFRQLAEYVIGLLEAPSKIPKGVILYHNDSQKISRFAALRKCAIDTERILEKCIQEMPNEFEANPQEKWE